MINVTYTRQLQDEEVKDVQVKIMDILVNQWSDALKKPITYSLLNASCDSDKLKLHFATYQLEGQDYYELVQFSYE